MTQRTNWTLWRSFIAVYETGSLSKAAQHLGMSQPTIGRHIKELEEALARPLFLRSQIGLKPTALADSMAPMAQVMANAAMKLDRQATARELTVSGTIRISASNIVAVEIFPKSISAFRKNYPSIAVELIASDEQEDVLNHSVDLAIRMTRPTQERLSCKRIGIAKIGLYAHRSYLQARGHPEKIEDLFTHDLIGLDQNTHRLQNYQVFDRLVDSVNFSFRCDNDLAQLAALRAGLGIGVCQNVIAQENPDLKRVLPSEISIDLPVWLVRHEGMKNDPLIELTFQYLSNELQQLYAKQNASDGTCP